jgi:hypothetical protein
LSEHVAEVFNMTRLLINPHSTQSPFEGSADLASALVALRQPPQ